MLVDLALVLMIIVMLLLLSGWLISGQILKRRTTTDLPPNDVKQITCHARDKITLNGLWFNHRARPVVVICGGHSQTMLRDVPVARSLSHSGVSVVLFDWRGRGQSGGQRSTFGLSEGNDLSGVLDYVQSEGIQTVGILGFSMGAAVALRSSDPRIMGVIADSPMYDAATVIRGTLHQRYGIFATTMTPIVLLMIRIRLGQSLQSLRLTEQTLETSKKAVHLITGGQDPLLPENICTTLLDSLPENTTHWHVRDAGHRDAYTIEEERYVSQATAIFGRWLV